MSRTAEVILFKESGKYYTSESWSVPDEATGPWDLRYSKDFRRIGNGAVLVPTQEPWGFPHLLVPLELHDEKVVFRTYPGLNQVEVKYLRGAEYPPQPTAHEGDVGLDIFVAEPSALVLTPGAGAFLRGGFQVRFNRGWFGMVLPRSSANRNGLLVHTGVIDNGYTGEIGVQVTNVSLHDFVVEPGSRLAQLVLFHGFRPVPVPVDSLGETDRGDRGWGSTG